MDVEMKSILHQKWTKSTRKKRDILKVALKTKPPFLIICPTNITCSFTRFDTQIYLPYVVLYIPSYVPMHAFNNLGPDGL